VQNWPEDIFKPTIGNESIHQDCNDNGVGIVNFAISKNFVAKVKMFPHRNIHTYTLTSTAGKTRNHIGHILIAGRGHSIIIDVRLMCYWSLSGGCKS